jgi:hypothetical protein
MKTILLLCVMSAVSLAQNIVPGSVSMKDVSHSGGQIVFSTDAGWNYLRIRYATAAEGSCATGNGNLLATQYDGNNNRQTDRMQKDITGLQANTPYTICPEVSSDYSTWHGGQATSITTPPLPATHPALPRLPTVTNQVYPDTSDPTKFHPVALAADCSNLQSTLDFAFQHQLSFGTVITADPSTVCTTLYQPDVDSDGTQTFASNASTINMANSTLTIPNLGDEGQALVFAQGNYGGLPGSGGQGGAPLASDATACRGVASGSIYYKHIIDQSHPDTFQLTCWAPYGQSNYGHTGTIMQFDNPGGGNALKVSKYLPGMRYPVILRTSVPDSQFVPPETRVSPSWAPKMPTLRMDINSAGVGPGFGIPTCSHASLLATSRCDGGNPVIISDLWIVGWKITTRNFLDNQTSVDGGLVYNIMSVDPNSQDIVIDRCYVHPPGAPNRIKSTFGSWNGHNVTIKNSWFDNQDMFQSDYNGLRVTQVDSHTVTISPGIHGINGAATYVQNNPITLSLSGTSSVPIGDFLISAALDGSKMNISLPPGVTGTCSGGPCNVFTSLPHGTGNGVYSTSHGFPFDASGGGGSSLYWVSPVFNTSATMSGATGLLDNMPDPSQADYSMGPTWVGGTFELGTKFFSHSNGYIPGMRFYKDARDTSTSHTVTLWDGSGNILQQVTTSGETASGWQTATFSPAVPIAANTAYTVSYYSTIGVLYADNWYQNSNWVNGQLEAYSNYTQGTGACDGFKQWPKNWAGHTRVGVIACGATASGNIIYLENANARATFGEVLFDNGSNAIQAGLGPGPYLFQNNHFEIDGNGIHHNEAGSDNFDIHLVRYDRHDYLYRRNEIIVPLKHMKPVQDPNDPKYGVSSGLNGYDSTLIPVGSPALFYQNRQPLEWKAGDGIQIDGNKFLGQYNNTSSSDFIAMTSVCDQPIRDVTVTNNTFAHGPGVMVAMSSTQGGCLQPSPTRRFRYENNLAYDLRAAYFSQSIPPVVGPGQGWMFNNMVAEDGIIRHNTTFLNKGISNSIITLYDDKSEGVQITKNIFTIFGFSQGVLADNSGVGPGQTFSIAPPCRASTTGRGINYMNCQMPNSTFTDNVFMGDDTATNIGNWLPGNKIVATPNNPDLMRWWNLDTAYPPGAMSQATPPATPLAKPNFRLKSDSPYVSGGSQHATDFSDYGVDMEALEIAQGKVTLIGTSGITGTASTISWIAPDSQACSVDYSSSDQTLINFPATVRVTSPTISGRKQSVSLSGLAPHTVYRYRINCMSEQPSGLFRTP